METRCSYVECCAIVAKHRNQISINGLVGRKMKRKSSFHKKRDNEMPKLDFALTNKLFVAHN